MNEKDFSKLRGNRIGMIFQDPMTSLNPVFRIGDQLEEVYMEHAKGNRKEARERAEFLLEKVGIVAPTERLSQYPHQLSGGLRQRMMIAMSLMCDPALILADEPTGNLDSKSGTEILNFFDELHKAGNTLIIVTHEESVAKRAKRRVKIFDGKIASDE